MESIITLLFQIAVGVVGSLMAFVLKAYHSRLSHIERVLDKMMSEDQVRLLLNDKLEPLKDRITIIEAKLDKIIDILLKDSS